jgi:bleomycin hydrolase
MNQNGSIAQAMLDEAKQAYKASPVKTIAGSVILNGIDNTSRRQESLIGMRQVFSDEIEPLEITNQKKSGRCWIFAGMNVLRYHINQTLEFKDKNFELSQPYMMFYDKLEKANYFLESVIETAGEPKDGRMVMWQFANLMQDGGQWDMLVNLIKKYGVVPKYTMPESFHSGDSQGMNAILIKKLRKDGAALRRMIARGDAADMVLVEKEKMVGEIYGMLCCFLGEPPETFNFEYRDKDNVYHRDPALTPLAFFHKYVGEELIDAYVSLINAPTEDKPYGKTYTVKYLGNVVGGKPVVYLNLESEQLSDMARRQVQSGAPVWFGCDVGKLYEKKLGIMDTGLYDYDAILHTDLSMTKEDMLDYGHTFLTHAMTLMAVDVEDGRIKKWKVENSWGDEFGEKGFFVMSQDWFKLYTHQVVVHKKYLSEEQLQALKQPPVELKPWDPIGSLAGWE